MKVVKEKTLSNLIAIAFVLGVLTICLGTALMVLLHNYFAVIVILGIFMMLGLPQILTSKLKVDVKKELSEKNRTIMQELLYRFLKGNYGHFLPKEKFESEAEIMTTYARIGYLSKKKMNVQNRPLYIDLEKNHFRVSYLKQKIVRKYDEFIDVDLIAAEIKRICADLVK